MLLLEMFSALESLTVKIQPDVAESSESIGLFS